MKTLLYTRGRWTVTARPTDKGAVRIAVWRGGRGWENGTYSSFATYKDGYMRPRWYQQSVERALQWGVALADKMHRKDVEAQWALEAATEAVESLQAQSDALQLLEDEM